MPLSAHSGPSPTAAADGERVSTAPGSGETDWERKRRRIIDGAAEVFARRGYDRGTTKDVAARVGLSQPSIYHYVGSKADLLREIALQVDRDLLAALVRGLRGGPTPSDQLRGIVVEFTRAVVANRFTFAVYRTESRRLDAEVAAEVAADERAFVAAVEQVVVEAQADGALPAMPPAVLTYALLNMVSETYRWYRPEGRLDPDQVAAAFCRLVGLG